MGYYDVMQVCENGHIITENYNKSPQFRKKYCTTCGAKTIHTCPSCGMNIKGEYHVENVISLLGGRSEPPNICEYCGSDFPWRNISNKTSNTPSLAMQKNSKKISIVTRQAIFDEITINRISWAGRLEEPNFLNRIFNLSELPSTDSRYTNAYDDIHKHRIMNYDWEDDWVFTDNRFNLLHCEEPILLQFLCLTIHPAVRSDQDSINQLLRIYNNHLSNDGYEIYQESEISGKPIYGAREITDIKSPPTTTKKKEERRLALVIGCGEYEFAGKLDNPSNDIKSMQEKLQKLGFDVILKKIQT